MFRLYRVSNLVSLKKFFFWQYWSLNLVFDLARQELHHPSHAHLQSYLVKMRIVKKKDEF
jgi:hypothetical protein